MISVCAVSWAALTCELLRHWALPFGYVAGEPVEQQSTLSAHLSPGCLAVLCLTARERENKCNTEMKTSSLSMSEERALCCICPPVKAFEVIKWSKKKKKTCKNTSCSKPSHIGRYEILIWDQKLLWPHFLVLFYFTRAGVETTGWGCTSSPLRHYQA